MASLSKVFIRTLDQICNNAPQMVIVHPNIPSPQLPSDFRWLNRLFGTVGYLEFDDPLVLVEVTEIRELLEPIIADQSPDIIFLRDHTGRLNSILTEEIFAWERTYRCMYQSYKTIFMFAEDGSVVALPILELTLIYA